MRFSLDWIRQHVDLSGQDAAAVAAALTSVGLAVETVEETGGDVALDVDVTTNRPDAMCHRGLARELSAILARDLRKPERTLPEADLELPANLVVLEAPDLCPRYASRVIEGITVGPSPKWLVDRLATIGSRSINNVVDATNYVLWDLGHPLHAFDRDVLAGGRIVVRRPAPNETLTTLDGEKRVLPADCCVIADARHAVAVAGVMGGQESGVGERTKNVLLESAWFLPSSIRKTSRILGLHTDASHRFERGAGWDSVPVALDAVASLILELAGGRLIPGRFDLIDETRIRRPKRILLRHSRIERIAGTPVPPIEAEKILVGLGFDATPAVETPGGPRGWDVTVPTARVDVEIEDDLVEEVLRHHGYSKIPELLPPWPHSEGKPTPARQRERAVRDALLACGLDEVVTYSFVSAADEAAIGGEAGSAPALSNPLAETMAVLRTSLLASLLPAAAHNVRHGRRDVALFEVGRIFRQLPDGAVREQRAAGFVLGGRWPRGATARTHPEFADAKGIVEAVLERLGTPAADVRPSGVPPFAAGRSADLFVDPPGDGVRSVDFGNRVAVFGELAPAVLRALELPGVWLAGEILLGEVVAGAAGTGLVERPYLPAPAEVHQFRAFSRFPPIEHDVTLEHDRTIPLARILREARAEAPPLLETVELRDRYEGKGVPDGRVRTTLGFTFRSPERSLTQEEVREAHERLVATLLSRLGATRA